VIIVCRILTKYKSSLTDEFYFYWSIKMFNLHVLWDTLYIICLEGCVFSRWILINFKSFKRQEQSLAGFEQDSAGFEQDSEGIEQDSAGFEQDSAGFKQDSSGIKQGWNRKGKESQLRLCILCVHIETSSLWAECVNNNRCISVHLVSEEVKSIKFW